MNLRVIVVTAVLVVGYGGVGIAFIENSPPDGQSDSIRAPTVAESSPPSATPMRVQTKPEADVNISLTWVEQPPTIESEGTLRISVEADRAVLGEQLFVSVPEEVRMTQGERRRELALERGDERTFTVTVQPTTDGVHRIHVYTSNLYPEEEGTLRASELITVGTPEKVNEMPNESTAPVERPTTSNTNAVADRAGFNGHSASAGARAASADSITIDGYFGYERDNDPYGSGLEGGWGARIEIWEADPNNPDEHVKTVYVDRWGNFDAEVAVQSGEADGEMELYIKAFSENDEVARSEDKNHNVHWWRWPGSGTVSKSSGETWSPSFKATSGEGWLHILRNLMEGHTYVEQEVGYDIPKEIVEWNQTTSHGSHHHLGGKEKIHMAGEDGWDDDVVLHEYGHHVMAERYGYTPGDPETHNMWTNTDLDTAWVEGWPTYFEAAVQGEGDYEDINNGVQVFDWSLESGGQCGGITCEGAVIKALWDMDDSNADSRSRRPYERTVELDDNHETTFSDIWDAFASSENSEMIGDGGDHVDSIVEFRTNWYQANSVDEDVLIELFALNRLPENNTVSWNGDPTAWSLIGTSKPNVGSPVGFDGSFSSDPEGGFEAFEWDADDDGFVDDTGMIGSYNYSTYGTYTVELTVVDNVGAVDSGSTTFDVAPAPVCSTCDVPTDPDDDDRYEDVDGNGVVDFTDVVLLYQEQEEGDASLAFDFDENGKVDFTDVVLLYQEQE